MRIVTQNQIDNHLFKDQSFIGSVFIGVSSQDNYGI